MNLSGQIALTAARLLQQRAQGYAGRALRLAREGAELAAARLEVEGPRISVLAEAGLRATALSYQCFDQLVRQGLTGARGALTDGAERLRITAEAESLSALYEAQRATLPASRKRIARELGAAWEIVVATSRELAKVARSARHELDHGRGKRGHARSRSRSRGGKRAPRRRAAAANKRPQS
jgi:hypothetical protein